MMRTPARSCGPSSMFSRMRRCGVRNCTRHCWSARSSRLCSMFPRSRDDLRSHRPRRHSPPSRGSLACGVDRDLDHRPRRACRICRRHAGCHRRPSPHRIRNLGAAARVRPRVRAAASQFCSDPPLQGADAAFSAAIAAEREHLDTLLQSGPQRLCRRPRAICPRLARVMRDAPSNPYYAWFVRPQRR